ncbi:hypothetical protein [Avibacterium paragallinarum]|uniref:Uncharacterized protein n=1 Tax=Avibacterium paragallinarum TaxID=728 RepID=A0A380X2V9_AVIPA|nr:hypothetical protein [Avibacterium paragallinarum]SUU97064.1 Uncharacterised protein [Avibacterium paragallinarum]
MKYIEKQLEDSRTGAGVNYHEVTGLQVDYLNNATYITMASYVSKTMKDAGKELLSVSTFTLPSVPDWSQIPYEWALKELIKAQPEDYVPEEYEGYVNPYLFAGGKVKDN